jgi:hypothetical protein
LQCYRRLSSQSYWNSQASPPRQGVDTTGGGGGGITQKKTYNIQNTVKFWNQDSMLYMCTEFRLYCSLKLKDREMSSVTNAADKCHSHHVRTMEEAYIKKKDIVSNLTHRFTK